MSNINSCPFCQEFVKENSNILNESRIIAETNSFILLPTTGGFIENYLLILPKTHLNCFGELTIEQFKELKRIIEWQKKVNKDYFNCNTSMFEHGALHPVNTSGKSIVHAHLHIFPNNKTLIPEINKYGFSIIGIDDIEDLNKICINNETYLYYSDINDKNYVILHTGIPSQFLRKVLADSKGISNWNWREDTCVENLKNTLEFYKKNEQCYEIYDRKEINNDNFTKRKL